MEIDHKNKDSNKGKRDSIAEKELFVTSSFCILESPEKRPKAEKAKKNKKSKKEEK